MGETTIKKVTPDGSWRIYALNGKNMAAGVLADALTLDGSGGFSMEVEFDVTADAIGAGGFFEFGVDVFQQGSGSDEGMCVEVASKQYEVYEENKPSPPFVMYCFDNGDGTFRAGTHAIHPKPIPSPPCGALCNLNWYYCPRDPGCVTYTMTVTAVEVDVDDSTGVHPNDGATVIVNGTTSLKVCVCVDRVSPTTKSFSQTPYPFQQSIEVAATYRIYDLAGHNAAAGLLEPIMSLYDCNDEGCSFGLAIGFKLVEGCFDAERGWFEFGLDIFQKSSETDEGVCIEVTNDAYLQYEETHPQPPPGFVTYCLPSPYGHFHKVTPPPKEVVDAVKCDLE